MKDLSGLCFHLDDYHYVLFEKYKDKLSIPYPEEGFLKNDCFVPAEEECYGVISIALSASIIILEKLKMEFPEEVHQHLRQLNQFSNVIEKAPAPKSSSKEEEHHNALKLYNEMQDYNKKASKFLELYSYKLDSNYQANNALILSTLLYASVQKSMKQNIPTVQEVLEIVSNNEQLTLNEIAKKICAATEKTARTLQFIAIGVTSSGEAWATTNYHSPVIYPLSYFLSKNEYKKAEKLRSQYKVAHRKSIGNLLTFSSGDNMIHAETMIASLKSLLDIQNILLVDGGGKKVENCQFCSHYLCQAGFSSEPHMESIQNYATPTLFQSKVSVNFGLSLQEKSDESIYRWIKIDNENLVIYQEAIALSNELLKQAFKLLPYNQPLDDSAALEQLFVAIKKYYPFILDNCEGLKETYHLSRKLADPNADEFFRTIVRKETSSKRHANLKIKLFDDNRLMIDPSGNHLKSTEPTSPRSSTLAKYANDWLNQGDPSVRFVQQGKSRVIELRR